MIHLSFTPLFPFFCPGVDFPSPPALVNRLPYFPAFGCPYLRATTSSLISDGQPLIDCQSYQQQDCPGSEIFQLGLTVLCCWVLCLSSLQVVESITAIPHHTITRSSPLNTPHIYTSIGVSTNHLCKHAYLYLSVPLPSYLSMHSPICLSVCLPIHLCIHPSVFFWFCLTEEP